MSNLLLIETSGTFCSVGLSINGQLTGYSENDLPNCHASQLTLMVANLLKNVSIEIGDLDAVAVSAGPGSYTGLRIGFAVAKGLCYAMGIPMIRISTLRALAFQMIALAGDEQGIYVPVIEAGGNHVYSGIYEADGTVIVRDGWTELNKELLSYYDEGHKIYLGGSGILKCQKIIQGNNKFFLEGLENKASGLLGIAEIVYLSREFENIAYQSPFYLREFEGKRGKI